MDVEGRRKKEEGSSATDCVTDVTDVTDVKDGSPMSVGRSPMSVGRRKKEEGRRKKEEGRRKKEDFSDLPRSPSDTLPLSHSICPADS
ncbi:MAG: hypothetical protein EAZ60_07520 [Oscillatoriales cyanobacterium]|uniref:hypothetical protein n=1 Tax=unclassified Microcoleus TaxID=2642155 RepID=UPI001DE09356|nr:MULTISPECIES: hypothetical protein [unclassified Microcoleus]MCC3458217.1 hypothetical protein [Microcoleus sp. PH2017_11_PCY_U_A]TAE84877.1 MAG: hypothetical protein EAZ83_04685 [Oscillatoriales cyanobacterium]MCC3529536.1 hypothetical protein [Microcoleus sp. PH2017_21_RUC_O_A]MCC3542878.1 hypothetical protein [Microcoleus sp. PH2017_22_RUC_O_B]MCC3557736.1 hypothetical protein [Microcoleus sp. PH2017_27_LUM_O_A]